MGAQKDIAIENENNLLRNLINLKNDFESFDLEIFYNDDYTICVRTFEDRSVGIYGKTISPTFEKIEELIIWWDAIKEIYEIMLGE